MNEFFKYLIPQLLEFFKGDKEVIPLLIPKMIEEKTNNNLKIEINKNIKN